MGAVDGILGAARAIRGASSAEDVHDFMGVVEIDPLPDMGVLVMPNHVAAVLEVSGTSYLYASPEMRERIIDAWAGALNNSRMSVQFYLLVRPIGWSLPGGFLDHLDEQVAWSDPSPWQLRRAKRWREAIEGGELERLFAVSDVGQYLIVRHAIGEYEAMSTGGEDVYLPPRRGWRFWERIPSALGLNRDEQLARWRARRAEAVESLITTVTRAINDFSSVPGPTGGMNVSPLSGVALTQLVHYLWRGDRAFGASEWVADEATLAAIRSGRNV